MSSGYSVSHQPAVQKFPLGTLLGVGAFGQENNIKVGMPMKAEFNRQNFKVGSPGFNKHDADLNAMRKFLSNTDKTLMDAEGAQELVTVAETIGRRGAIARARTIIINQLSDPSTSPYFRVLPPKEMTEQEVAGVEQNVLVMGYTPMVEAPEFSPPHFITFKTQIYRSSSFRFNIGFRYNAEHLLTKGGIELVDQFAKRTVGNIIQFMEQMVMSSLMRVQDAYVGSKIMYREAASSMEELVDRIRYNGPTTGGSFLMSKKMVGIIQREDGLSYLLNWVKDVTLANDTKIDTMFHPPGMFRDIAFEYTDYSKQGPRAHAAADGGADFVEGLIKTSFGSISVIPNKTIFMNDARVEREQHLASHMQAGHWNLVDNEVYKRNAAIQSTRGLDSSAHRYASSINDLWFLNFQKPSIVKERQSFEELVAACVCFDENGELNERVYKDMLLDVKQCHQFARALGVNVTDAQRFKPDPWLVRSGDTYKLVRMVGNQDVCHTSIKDTEFAVNVAYNIISKTALNDSTTGLNQLMKLAENNFNVRPDSSGEVEAFWNAIAWYNVGGVKNEGHINYIPKVRLPTLIETFNRRGTSQRKCAYQRVDSEMGHNISLFKVPVVDSEGVGALFDSTAPINFDAIFATNPGNAAAMVSGYLFVSDGAGITGMVDIWSLLFLNENAVSVGDMAIARNLINTYVLTFNDPATARGGVNVLADVRTLGASGVLRASDITLARPYPYPNPGLGSVLAANPAVCGYKFSNFPWSEFYTRITAGHMQHIYYRSIFATQTKFPNMTSLRDRQYSHPSYEWLDSKLAYDSEVNHGYIDGERITTDPTKVDRPGLANMPLYSAFDHRSFFSVKMRAAGFVQASFFYCFEDLQHCRLAGVEKGKASLPGFSTIYSLHCVAEQMKDGYNGWDLVGAQGMMDDIIEASDHMRGFSELAFDIFCPTQSSQSHQPTQPGIAFMHDKFLARHQYSKKDSTGRENAIRCFSNMITEASTRNFGMMQPFTNYPLHWAATAIKSDPSVSRPYETVHKHNHVEATFRYTDVEAIVNATPFMLNKALFEVIGTTRGVTTRGVAGIERISTYDYLSNDADSRPTSSSRGFEEFNFLKATPIENAKTRISAQSQERGFVYAKFHHDIIARLSRSESFVFDRSISNESDSNPEGVGRTVGVYPGFKLTGEPGSQEARDFYDKYILITDKAYSMFNVESDIREYNKAVFVATRAVEDYFDYMFSSPGRINDPSEYNPTQAQWTRWSEAASDQAEEMKEAFRSAGRGDISEDADFVDYMRKVKTDFLNSVAVQQSGRSGGVLLSVTNMMLSMSTKYWTAVDKKFKLLYNLPYDGMGVQFSMVRPQNKYTREFLDVTFYPNGTSISNARFAETMRKYKELLAYGPGPGQSFDFHTTLTKLSGGHDEHAILEDFGANEFFNMRMDKFKGDWMKRAIALAYLTARPTADLMINLHRHGIPPPITIITLDPLMDFMMHGILFAEAGLGGGWIGHAFTLHTASFNSSNREAKHHFSTWLHPHTPYPNKVLYLPHAAFAGVYSGCSGKLVQTVAYFRPTSAENPNEEEDAEGNRIYDWNSEDPRHRRADRFVVHGGGSLTRKDLPIDINITGSNNSHGSNLYCGMDLNLPPGLIQPVPANTMTYPSALVANYVFGFFRMNQNARGTYLNPKNMCDIRYNIPGDADATYNLWCSAAPQFATNPKTGFGDIKVYGGDSVVSHVGEGQGEILFGMPSMFTQREMTANA
jgi:hypothetical protein